MSAGDAGANQGGETVGAYLTSWLQHSKTRVRTKTFEGYEALVRLYARPGIGDLPLASLSPLALQRLYADLLSDRQRPLSGGSVLNLHLVLTQAFAQAVRWGVMIAIGEEDRDGNQGKL